MSCTILVVTITITLGPETMIRPKENNKNTVKSIFSSPQADDCLSPNGNGQMAQPRLRPAPKARTVCNGYKALALSYTFS